MEISQFVYYFLSSVGFSAAVILWINAQFNKQREQFFGQIDKVLDKLEYHERHDDTRFGNIANQLMEIRIIQAKAGLNGKKSINRDSEAA